MVYSHPYNFDSFIIAKFVSLWKEINEMEIKKILSEREYHEALKRPGFIFNAKPDPSENLQIESLVDALDEYENNNFSIERPGSLKSVKFHMEQMGNKE
jgi:antitoxin component HigA of HigAB toxin-antitoxin module